MIIKIVISRYLGNEGIGLYYLIIPTFMLLITISSFSFTVSISKLVSEGKNNNKKIISSSFPISLFINFILMIFIIISSKFISNNLLHNEKTYYGLLCIAFVLPFIGISSIIRGYFIGKEKMFPHVFSNIIEDIIKLFIIIIGLPFFISKGIEYAIAFIILSNIITELSSILILTLFLPKSNIKICDLKPKKKEIKKVIDISIPTTEARIIGNIGYFLEPIIFTSILLSCNMNSGYITNEYGIISGYVLPLLLLPSFFSLAISQALIPVISKAFSDNNINFCKYKIKQAILLCLLIGIPITILFEINPYFPLKIIYNTNQGINYIRFLAPICLLQYIQSPLSSSMQAMGKAKETMHIVLFETILRITCLIVFTKIFHVWGLILSISITIIITTVIMLKKIKKYIK